MRYKSTMFWVYIFLKKHACFVKSLSDMLKKAFFYLDFNCLGNKKRISFYLFICLTSSLVNAMAIAPLSVFLLATLTLLLYRPLPRFYFLATAMWHPIPLHAVTSITSSILATNCLTPLSPFSQVATAVAINRPSLPQR